MAFKKARQNGSKGLYALHLVNDGAEVDAVCGTLWHNSKAPGIRLNFAHVRAA